MNKMNKRRRIPRDSKTSRGSRKIRRDTESGLSCMQEQIRRWNRANKTPAMHLFRLSLFLLCVFTHPWSYYTQQPLIQSALFLSRPFLEPTSRPFASHFTSKGITSRYVIRGCTCGCLRSLTNPFRHLALSRDSKAFRQCMFASRVFPQTKLARRQAPERKRVPRIPISINPLILF